MRLPGGRDLGQRALSSLVLAPVVLAATYFGGVPFVLLWTLAGLAILMEWADIARLERRRVWLALAGAALVGASVTLHLGAGQAAFSLLCLGAASSVFILPRQSAFALGGVLVAGAACLPVMALRSGEQGFAAVLFLLSVVWATDIFAYFVGRLIGGPRLWPRVSPNKTWAGSVGGALAGMAAGIGVGIVAGLPSVLPLGALAFLVSIAAQCGDLAESAAKRTFGVKDAGRLIPGHGGLLDRLDGFAAASLLAVAIGVLRNAADPAAGLLLW
ncbi:phosphatidate cytidylyltransferase [Xanthobacter tagetidis]|jgi:phosphatidate cytidylyltransferase|uniref:Phosphatidate cytidylyltransferase n=1 Tax=Xanthobacter tagetidis TaxID=60216 RepID=A0A3L7ABQ3_9HYPH|nr:phosphatidate cytidylyltransferase [Xanthobacter tagetidis]MBB6309606.1 phosphatidate cytidylyltransferase [Xanthobacter tagetidis]RLP77158.1 phosphatidate cytidylyltransferase [Xanthobacter tagetidis]